MRLQETFRDTVALTLKPGQKLDEVLGRIEKIAGVAAVTRCRDDYDVGIEQGHVAVEVMDRIRWHERETLQSISITPAKWHELSAAAPK